MDEAHDVGILLDGAALTQVAQLRAAAHLVVDRARLDRAVELRKRDDGNVEFLGQALERARDVAHLLLTAAELGSRRVHQLQIVDDDDAHVVLTHQAARFGLELEDR